MKKSFKCSFLVILIFITLNTLGQVESFPCKCCNNDLKNMFQGQGLKSLYVHSCTGEGLHGLSSSFLMPEGIPPKIIEDPQGGPPDDGAYVKWTCRYSVGSLTDSDSKTAWVEGVEGPGIGEVLIVPCLDLKKPIKIWAGYGKSDAVFKSNNRPKKLRTVIFRGEMSGASQYGYNYENITIVADKSVVLADKNEYQHLPIPKFTFESYFSSMSNEKVEYQYFLGIEILEVYKGLKYDDTCISEIINQE